MASDRVALFFIWLIPSTVLGIVLFHSEQFGYELRDCQPHVVFWLRWCILDYLWTLWWWCYLPSILGQYQYKKFREQFIRLPSMIVTYIDTVLGPWVTLGLYLGVRNRCGNEISKGQATFYWTIFGVQVVLSLMSALILYVRIKFIKEIISAESEKRKMLRNYNEQAIQILHSGRNLPELYSKLICQGDGPTYLFNLYAADIQIFRLRLCRPLDDASVEILNDRKRICFRCDLGFKLGDKVQYIEHCGHLVHWECFESDFILSNKCGECNKNVVNQLKNSVRFPSETQLLQHLQTRA